MSGGAPAGYTIERATKDDRSFIEIAALDKVAWLPEDHSDGEHAWRLCESYHAWRTISQTVQHIQRKYSTIYCCARNLQQV